MYPVFAFTFVFVSCILYFLRIFARMCCPLCPPVSTPAITQPTFLHLILSPMLCSPASAVYFRISSCCQSTALNCNATPYGSITVLQSLQCSAMYFNSRNLTWWSQHCTVVHCSNTMAADPNSAVTSSCQQSTAAQSRLRQMVQWPAVQCISSSHQGTKQCIAVIILSPKYWNGALNASWR